MNAIQLLKKRLSEKSKMNSEKFSIASIAGRLEMQPEHLNSIIRGETKTKTLVLIRICEELELNIHEVRELTQLYYDDKQLES